MDIIWFERLDSYDFGLLRKRTDVIGHQRARAV